MTSSTEETFPVLEPGLQISFYRRLQEIKETNHLLRATSSIWIASKTPRHRSTQALEECLAPSW